MGVKAYFENIHQVILQQVKSASQEINVAVAWFTDRQLFDALCERAMKGVKVSVALINDEINCGTNRLNFAKLQNLKGTVTFIEPKKYARMHNKFCVIDKNVVITGSYNWTRQARSNDENITVITESPAVVEDFLEVFAKLTSANVSPEALQISSDTVRRRLEMIKNFILLDEIEDISSQVKRLKPAAEAYQLGNILHLLEQGKYQLAIEEINDFLKKFTALVVSEDYEAVELRFELKILELRLESLSNEQADLERNILLFNRMQYEILGDITQQILALKKRYYEEKARKMRERPEMNDEEELASAQEQAQEAKQTYEDYSEEFEETKQTKVQQLNKEQQKSLKKLFRQCSALCHPDKVSEALKEQASQMFIEVKNAYDNNDIEQLTRLYQALKAGNFAQTRSSTLKQLDVLRSSVAEMRYKIDQVLQELQAFQQNPVLNVLQRIGSEQTDWEAYLNQQRPHLENERQRWEALLAELIEA
ncbi:phospholipase D-like domain-containing protein [Avibacterium avium]|uniref:phospholipase D-like domain-containing protein n=1 Tax=Avibacterium avium TaxID=751 RepID=UPI003BF8CD1F